MDTTTRADMIYNEEMIRRTGKTLYADRSNVRRKWLTQYGRVDEAGSYQRNKSVLSELFNLLDMVMDNKLEALCAESVRQADVEIKGRVNQCWEHNGVTAVFRAPKFYSERIYALRQFGVQLPEGVNEGTRFLRNDLTHGSETVLIQYVNLDLPTMHRHLSVIGHALNALDILDPADITPSFDALRIREGMTLQSGAFLVGRQIGEGGMSRVFEGWQKNLNRKIAIKELKPEAYAKEVIQNECAALVRLRHPQIPRIIDTFAQNFTYYIIMEFIDGEDLLRFIRSRNPAPRQRLDILMSLCDILSYLHDDRTGIVFCDLKPENVMIDAEGKPNLIDFGISRSAVSREKQVYASALYTAPEVLAGQPADWRSDLYALGRIIEFLFPGTASLPLQQVISRCTAEDPAQRFASAAEIKAALAACAAGSKPAAGTTSAPRSAAAQRPGPAAQGGPSAQSAGHPAAPAGSAPVARSAPQRPASAQPRPAAPQWSPPAGKASGSKWPLILIFLGALVLVLLTVLLILLLTEPASAAEATTLSVPGSALPSRLPQGSAGIPPLPFPRL